MDRNDQAPASAVQLDPQAHDGHVKSAEEKRYLRKLDLCLLTFTCISQLIKYLDQQNINFAYTSGMKESLNLYGNELNYFTTYFNVGYCIFLVPSQIMITRFKPAIWLSCLELIWGALTLGLAGVKNHKQVYAIRAFIGAAESSAYPGAVALLMTWYTPLEMAKRIGFYHSCQPIGSMVAGGLQAAILKSLDGSHGLEGWRWTFIINGIMTIVIAALGFFMIPDFPDRPNKLAFWFTAHDKRIAEDRLLRWRRVAPDAINWRTAKKAASTIITPALMWLYTASLIAVAAVSYFNLFLKSLKHADGTAVWSAEALSAVPMVGYTIQILSTWFFAFCSDYFRTRWLCLLAIACIGIPSATILTIWNVSTAAKYYAFFALYATNTGAPIIWSWMSDMLPTEPEQRTLTISICISFYYAINAWSNPLIYPAKEAPHYKHGWGVSLGLYCSVVCIILALRTYDIKVIRPRNYRARLALEQEYLESVSAAQAVLNDEEFGASTLDKDKQGTTVVSVLEHNITK
ncbi:hypothetical protein I302_102516 [Kwoniella bestiolae CBS 10118]|uniref:Major facilitator superfamily (MFS) profile domain-containing protein n=1 Tax=Kwoniella bestiolae CBS 10118 TaxID=1296100 RepID=A0AAJ8M6T6_9TREE